MKHPYLLLIISIITFCIGTCFVYLTFYKPNNQESISPVLTQKAINPDWELLLSYENKDLTKINEEEYKNLKNVLDRLGARGLVRSQLGVFSKISNVQGKNYYVLIGMINPMIVPSNCELQVQLFDSQGTFLKYISFNSGWRMDLTRAKVEFISEISRELIIAESYPEINGRDVAKQYYGLINDEISLVKLENSKGEIVPNYYYASNHTIGSIPSDLTEQQWINSLNSNDIIEVLATLTFLGGQHSDKFDQLFAGEKSKRVKLVEKIHANQSVKLKISEFIKSDNRWLNDAANLFLNVNKIDD